MMGQRDSKMQHLYKTKGKKSWHVSQQGVLPWKIHIHCDTRQHTNTEQKVRSNIFILFYLYHLDSWQDPGADAVGNHCPVTKRRWRLPGHQPH